MTNVALNNQVVGQPEAVRAVSRAIQRSRNGLGNSTRPIASFLFTGVSGTGKTHLTKKVINCNSLVFSVSVNIPASSWPKFSSNLKIQ